MRVVRTLMGLNLWVCGLQACTPYLMSMHFIGVHLMGVHLMGVRRAPNGRAIYGRASLTEIINSRSYLRVQFTCRSYLPRVIPLIPLDVNTITRKNRA